MLLQTVVSRGLAHFSYVLGDEFSGDCLVIDPRRDVEVYLEIARENKVRISHIFETHIHADFVSGSRELSQYTGAPIWTGAADEIAFEHRPLRGGEAFQVGRLWVEALHTPGHTPEHISLLVSGGSGADRPWGLFSGDTLFAGEIGRPDLLGEGTEEKLAGQLFHTLHEIIFPLGDDIVVYPSHGEGSPCGASIGDRPTSTIGYERCNNPILAIEEQEEFVRTVLESLEPAPSYYARMKKVNAHGAAILGNRPHFQPLEADDFRRKMENPEAIVLDTREIEAYGGAHVPGSLHIGLREAFPIWAGRILDEAFPIWAGRMLRPEHEILLVLADEGKVDAAERHLLRVGYENFGGYIRQGMRSWMEAAYPFARTPQMSVHELKTRLDQGGDLQVLDVRTASEWREGNIPTASHIYVADLVENMEELDPNRPVATYCGSGYRASIAASILERSGFNQVYNIPGSFTAWQAAGYPQDKP
jgi:hydroxyacylglutathione hydrolase